MTVSCQATDPNYAAGENSFSTKIAQKAAVAQAETVVHPRSARGIDRLLAEAAAEVLLEPGRHLLAVDAELARVRVQPALVAVVVHARERTHG